MEVRFHESVEDFRAVAGTVYDRDPVTYTIELTVLRATTLPDDSVLLTVWDGADVVGAAMQTPPYPLACAGLSANGIDCAATSLAQTHPGLPGVRGPRDKAMDFAAAWRRITGADTEADSGERLYRLGRLSPPTAVTGEARQANADDAEVLADWVGRFYAEVFRPGRDPAAPVEFVAEASRVGDRFVLWTVAGQPVSMAMVRAPVAGVSRIGPVYTPDDQRGRGYGSAVTAAASRAALDAGAAGVVLFADLDNPVSNSIYQRIGFEPVSDWVRIGFSTARVP